MRTEKDIVNLANTMIGIAGLSCEIESVVKFDPINFFKVVASNTQLHKAFHKMTPPTFGEIISMGLGMFQRTDLRQTSVKDLFSSHLPFRVIWTGEDGEEILRHMAMTVITAMMYDILATERVMRVENAGGVATIAYRPQPGMKRFVFNRRLYKFADTISSS